MRTSSAAVPYESDHVSSFNISHLPYELQLDLCEASQRALLYLVSQIVFHLSRHIKNAAASSMASQPSHICHSNLRTGLPRSIHSLGGELLLCIILVRPCNEFDGRCLENDGMASGACARSNIFPTGGNFIHSVSHNLKYCFYFNAYN